ncbi:MAG TPA: ATP-binding protein, partial [Thermoanaerobaculia bacterium]|nr:ATP-binding protein [Thermoanaerobaculia bacterium]
MNLVELGERIARWEGLHTEFKEWPVHPDDLAASLVAFANTDGGQLILGVSESREIKGVQDPDRVIRDMDNVAVNNCEPPITVIQETLRPEGGGTVVVINVPKGDMRPYRTNRGVFYIRTSSGRRQASREELLRLFQATESLYYDETPMLRLAPSDLDMLAFTKFLKDTGQAHLVDDKERLLENWYLIANGHPTIAG